MGTVSGRGNGRSSVGACLVCSQHGKMASVAGAEGGWGRVEGNEATEALKTERWGRPGSALQTMVGIWLML